MFKIMISIFMIIVWITIFSLAIKLEKKDFNNGVCPLCNKKLIFFDTDSQGGRGYKCNCGYHTWVSYKCVDKKYLLGDLK